MARKKIRRKLKKQKQVIKRYAVLAVMRKDKKTGEMVPKPKRRWRINGPYIFWKDGEKLLKKIADLEKQIHVLKNPPQPEPEAEPELVHEN
jgi:hypothetical protein